MLGFVSGQSSGASWCAWPAGGGAYAVEVYVAEKRVNPHTHWFCAEKLEWSGRMMSIACGEWVEKT